MNILTKSVIVLLIVCFKCKEYNNPLCTNYDGESISVEVIEIRSLPYNTLTVINFDKVILYEGQKLIIADISNSNDAHILSEYELISNQSYNSIQLDRYIIIDDESDACKKEIIDIESGTITTIQDSLNIHQISISPIDQSILYSATYFDSSLRNIAKIKHIDSNHITTTLVDSAMYPKWSNNNNWFTVRKVLLKQGRFLYWESVLHNLLGEKVILTRDPYSMSRPIWTNDGTTLVYSITQNIGIMCIELDWQDEKPGINKKVTKFNLGEPFLWSDDGRYCLFVKYYDGDFLNILGNDIIITDHSLDLYLPVIEHNTIIELPLKWTSDNTLITYTADWEFIYGHFFPKELIKYKISVQ